MLDNYITLPNDPHHDDAINEGLGDPQDAGLDCRWDDCDDHARTWRYSHPVGGYIPVCWWHTQRGEEEAIVNKWIMRGLVKPA